VKRTTRRKITVETERLLVISSQPGAGVAWCERCKAETRMLDVPEAVAVSGLSARTIFRRVESGQLHFTETPEGTLLVCLNSLMERTSPEAEPGQRELDGANRDCE
jgi:hypothetical protein